MSAKILVVDDSTADRLMIEKMLNQYDVLTACDGIEAMQQIDENEEIQLVILDLNMPRMNGFEVLAALKSDERYKRVRTIILTNYEELENEIKGLELGAVDYIRKPISLDALKVRVNIHLELLRSQLMAEQRLAEQKSTFERIFNQAPIGISISYGSDSSDGISGVDTQINSMFEQIVGRTKEEMIELGWAKITHPDDLEKDLSYYKKLKSGEIEDYSMEKRFVRPDGSIVWVEMTVASLNLPNQKEIPHIALLKDITRRKTIEADLIESERSKSVLLSHIPGMAYRCNYDREWTMQYVSAGCFELTGYPSESIIGNRDLSFNDLIAPEYRAFLWDVWKERLAKREPVKQEYEIVTADGTRKWVLEMGEGIFDEKGRVEALEGIIIDISSRKKFENDLRYRSEHDNWTGLYNRHYLESLLESDASKRAAGKRAIVSINLSPVQSLTATYGFHYTQDLVKKIADMLTQFCNDKQILFNTYENRFAFYLKGYKDKNELTNFSIAVAKQLEPVLLMERTSGGIGVVEIDEGNEKDVDLLLRRLLITSEKAIDIYDRDIGVCFYNEEIEKQMIREQEITLELAKISTEQEDYGLFLQYQPILDLKSDRINSFEALSRLNIDKLGIVPPLEFIPIAEKTKLVVPIGRKIILQALRFLNELKRNGHRSIGVSINISAIQLLRDGFAGSLLEMIEQTQANPKNVGLEITESVFASNHDEINRILGRLSDTGIHIAIDDFGIGYSSLARERDLNVNCLKIDKSFIDRLMYLETDDAITSDIISMAHKLGHCAIAEGVEHEKQREYLEKWGCDKIQGYLISRPLDEKAAIEFLKTYNH
ncbi:EAL domain-containing protein [Mesotoga sp. BH458_6_3_2_1]|uniref:EAL domain-containing protein n=1 Tax=Mesotoga sp. BH458_6_3_2_1 TaxID=1437446 RepID=UPI000EF1BC7A|nr:EAL domain-containing protein [Mesotoga sp. BH458_6_3_2_1]RLL84436.1 diguanylate cyclase [Mesotoga sp. BH458_6_3_2_1]